jgi:aspartyl-tRNA(Asn)/glutamyl-tRNA(Gln) amidotransferase subunit C
LDTEAISPTASVLPLHSVMRDDEARPFLSREDILANAPAAEEGCFKVPAVLD